MESQDAQAGSRSAFPRAIWSCCAVVLLAAMSLGQTKEVQKPPGADPTPEPAVAAILGAFDKYEVVAMPEAHSMKDVDDFILSLIRNPAFPDKLNDIAVECGNALYQPILDRYIAGEDVPLKEAQKAWRNTTQPMCGMSAFFEQFFPLVRVINQKLPAAKRLRVLAGDPPIDWDQVKVFDDAVKFLDRDNSISSVMEKEVLSKHRKALMLFGVFHLMHGVSRSAVSAYEKNYPNVTFVISDFGLFDLGTPATPRSVFAGWPSPSLMRAKGTWLGAMDLSHFLPAPILMNKNCEVRNEFPKELQRPMENLVDAFLYLGPPDLSLTEQTLAYIALDADYKKELQRRDSLTGPGRGLLQQFDEGIQSDAENPIEAAPIPPDFKLLEQSCRERLKIGNAPK
jgi:hypothetical protein